MRIKRFIFVVSSVYKSVVFMGWKRFPEFTGFTCENQYFCPKNNIRAKVLRIVCFKLLIPFILSIIYGFHMLYI